MRFGSGMRLRSKILVVIYKARHFEITKTEFERWPCTAVTSLPALIVSRLPVGFRFETVTMVDDEVRMTNDANQNHELH